MLYVLFGRKVYHCYICCCMSFLGEKYIIVLGNLYDCYKRFLSLLWEICIIVRNALCHCYGKIVSLLQTFFVIVMLENINHCCAVFNIHRGKMYHCYIHWMSSLSILYVILMDVGDSYVSCMSLLWVKMYQCYVHWVSSLNMCVWMYHCYVYWMILLWREMYYCYVHWVSSLWRKYFIVRYIGWNCYGGKWIIIIYFGLLLTLDVIALR